MPTRCSRGSLGGGLSDGGGARTCRCSGVSLSRASLADEEVDLRSRIGQRMERGRSWSSQFLEAATTTTTTTNGFPYAAYDRSSAVSSSPPPLPSSPSEGVNYIEHRVTKKDTLAGVAIKYGVEVADIRRLNGLATDLQMFAHKSLRIPLPGRHPPCSFLSDDSDNNREQTPPCRPHDDIMASLQSLKLKPPRHKVSSAMNLLQGYYGLTPPPMRTGKSLFLDDESPLFRELSNSEPLPNQHMKSMSLVNGFSLENGEITEDRTPVDNNDVERSIRRRQKSDASPEVSWREENNGSLSGRTAKGLALRPKLGARADTNKSQQNLVLVGDPLLAEGLLTVRKSSSTPDLQDSDGSSAKPMSRWNLRPDSFALPIFDGLPKPASWRNKAARD